MKTKRIMKIMIALSLLLTNVCLNIKSKTVNDLVVVSLNDYNSSTSTDLIITNMNDLKQLPTLLDTSMFIYCTLEDIEFFNNKFGYNVSVEEKIMLGYEFVGLMKNNNTSR